MQPTDLAAITTAEAARDAAITWQHEEGQEDMSWGEVAEWGDAFEALGARFDLTDEFRENGII